jgi:hypothetical protein
MINKEIAKDLKKGVSLGYCRICGIFNKLSSDHIPPKSCGNNKKVVVTINELTFISQNGFNCKTICEYCNNELLGSRYDKEFKILYDKIISFQKSKLIISNNIIEIDINVNNVLKSILGHLLASNVVGKESIEIILSKEIERNFFILDEYRRYVLDEINEINNIDIYYWYYPYSDITLIPYFMKNINILDNRIPSIHGTIIKIYPIAICIIKRENVHFNHVSKLDLSNNKMTFNVNKELHKRLKYFPESVGTQLGIVAFYPDSVINVKK